MIDDCLKSGDLVSIVDDEMSDFTSSSWSDLFPFLCLRDKKESTLSETPGY